MLLILMISVLLLRLIYRVNWVMMVFEIFVILNVLVMSCVWVVENEVVRVSVSIRGLYESFIGCFFYVYFMLIDGFRLLGRFLMGCVVFLIIVYV